MLTFLPRRTLGAMRRKLAGSARSCMAVSIAVSIAESVGTDYHATTLGADAARGRLEQPDDAQPEPAVADRRGVSFANAPGKVAHRPLERLARLDVRAPD